jgi:hypothetical protein
MAPALALCLVTLSVLAAGPTAGASASTWHDRWTYLRFPAPVSNGPCVPTRRIYLAGGTYRWRVFTAHWAHADQTNWRSRTIRLTSGWYYWMDCLGPWVPSRPEPREYRLISRLYQSGRPGAYLVTWENGRRWGDGTYHWGSALDRVG